MTTAIEFTPEELQAFREELFQGFTDSQFNLAIAECKRRNLVPGQHIFFQLRNSSEWDPTIGAKVNTKKLTKVTTIDAFRLISHRTGEYIGQGKGKFYYLDGENNPTVVSEIPLPHPTQPNTPREPWAASIPIYRKGFQEPVEVVCRFDAYAVTRKSGQSVVLTDQWVRRGPEQLLKCSEAASRRAAFPEELGSFYLSEEFAREDAENKPEAPQADPKPLVEAPKAAVVPTVNHTPAVATNEPRPEEKQRTKKNAKDVKIEDVILDRVEVVGGKVTSVTVIVPPEGTKPEQDVNLKIDKPAPTVQPEINTAQSAEKTEPISATVQKMDNSKDNNTRLRELIAKGVDKDKLKQYILITSGREAVNQIPTETLKTMLSALEQAMESGGKKAVAAVIEPKPVEVEVF